ncbi:MAG TPA: acyltransferase [Gammaproteobacteria bacterium]|jgi:peptidoglycan/LPS O-acetylase OafA/YrhL
MSTGEAKSPAFLAPLEGMRGIAAVGVVLYHSFYHWQINRVPLIEHGNLFVDLFFVISGFVISHIYNFRLSPEQDLARFAVLRTARLYPLHLCMLLVLAAYTLGTAWARNTWDLPFPQIHTSMLANNDGSSFLENLFMLQGLISSKTPSFNSPSWSISTEYFTYFSFGLTLLIANPRSRWFPLVLAGITLAALGCLFWQGSLTHDLKILRCVGGFFSGALVYLAWTRSRPALRRWTGQGISAHLSELAAVGLTTAVLWYCGEGRAQFLLLPCFALLVFLLADGRGMVAAFLRQRHIQKIGKWSYSIYMVHFTVILAMSDLARCIWPRGPVEFTRWNVAETTLLSLLLLALVLLVSSMTYRYVEDPPRRWAKRWVTRRLGGGPTAEQDALAGAP